MFNRSDTGDPDPQGVEASRDRASADDVPTGDAEAQPIDGELEDGAQERPVDAASAEVEAATDHSARLRATREAQQQALTMLEIATAARSDATEQAERIVVEARETADRVRTETTEESDRVRAEAEAEVERLRSEAQSEAERLRVEAVEEAERVRSEAQREAEEIHAEAMKSAMEEAERTARLYVSDAAARGARDAEEIRGRARDVLHHASDLGEEIQLAAGEVSRAVESAKRSVADQLRAIEALLADTRHHAEAGTVGGDVGRPHDSNDAGSERHGEAAADPENDGNGDSDGGAEDEHGPAVVDETEESATNDSRRPEGRQLGSMFRTETQKG